MTEERDPKVSQRYRELPGEEPPRALDQKILAAARRATDKPHAPLVVPAGRHRWYYSLAAAAILVLAIAVTLHVEQQQPDPELAVPPTPAQAPAPALKPEAEPTPSGGAMADSAPARADAEGARARAEQAQAEAKAADLRKERAAGDVAASRAAPSPRSTTAPMVAQHAAPTPERELERIAELRAQGRHDDADKALAEFRKRYPDYRIPQAMLEKVERIRPAR